MRRLYKTGEVVKILSVDERQKKLGFSVGQRLKVLVDYEDLIYLESPVQFKIHEDFFYPEQITLI